MRKLLILLLILLAAACTRTDERIPPTAHTETLDANTLVFVTHNGPTTYYYNGDNELAGLEFALADPVAQRLLGFALAPTGGPLVDVEVEVVRPGGL
ncbi:MAG TPA: hypothetical protein PLG02_10180, partial [Methylotenera sp.]|nr:hypothetical protein [Methylotenera sp.]